MAEVRLVDIKKIYPNQGGTKKKMGDVPEKKHNLQITEEGVVAVQQFSLDIADREFIVLVGPSGCGKSTTLRMIAGLVAAGEHPSPFGLADIITTTTHKTLRGPRGGMIFCRPALAKKVDSAVFPGTQGGPLEHVIAGKAVAAEEACTDEYREYIHAVVRNCRAMCEEFRKMGYDVVTGGTDNHLFLLDLTKTGLTGKAVQDELDRHGITLNKNCVPNETRSPQQTSGVRIGTAAMTTKGYTEADFLAAAHRIDEVLRAMQAKTM